MGPGDLTVDIWSIFDRSVFDRHSDARVVPIDRIVCITNQLEDPEFLNGAEPGPRQTALEHMRQAAAGKLAPRPPISVWENSDGTFTVLDGNATVQVLMLLGWKEVAVVIMNQRC